MAVVVVVVVARFRGGADPRLVCFSVTRFLWCAVSQASGRAWFRFRVFSGLVLRS
jgi:hypothetical protein